MSTAWLRTAIVLWVALTPAAQAPDTESTFEKFEFWIPMRDGVRLYTAVYVPKDRSARYPILMYRTRYGVEHYGANDYAPRKRMGVKAIINNVEGSPARRRTAR